MATSSSTNSTLVPRISFSFHPSSEPDRGFLISDEAVGTFLQDEFVPVVNLWFLEAVDTLPVVGFSLVPGNEMTIPITQRDQQNFLLFDLPTHETPALPHWTKCGAKTGDRLRLVYKKPPRGEDTVEFRLNMEEPTGKFLINSPSAIYLVVELYRRDQVAVLTEDEVAICLGLGRVPLPNVLLTRRQDRAPIGVGFRGTSTDVGSSSLSIDSSTCFNPETSNSAAGYDNNPNTSSANVLKECHICLDRPADTLCLPCRHLVCEECSLSRKEQHYQDQRDLGRSQQHIPLPKCAQCRTSILKTCKVRHAVDRCLFDDCGRFDAVSLPCGCIVGCFEQAKQLNNCWLKAQPAPLCPACSEPVATFKQIYIS